jgi:hypothetical protein
MGGQPFRDRSVAFPRTCHLCARQRSYYSCRGIPNPHRMSTEEEEGSMQPTVIAGLVFMLAALVMYSLGVWGAFRKKGASKRHVMFLWIGVACDVLGTLMMMMQAPDKVTANLATNPAFYMMTAPLGAYTLVFVNDLKTKLALVALPAMAVFAGLATYASKAGREAMAKTLSRVILAPWALWVVVFLMGMKRG